MAETKDVEKEKKVKEEEEKKEEKKIGWFQTVPTIWKIGVAAIIFVKYLSIVRSGGDIKELWMWVIMGFVVLYFLGSAGKRMVSDVLTPEEADDALKAEIERMKRDGQIDRNAQVFRGPDKGFFHLDGLPKHYLIGVQIVSEDLGRQYKQGVVYAEGPTKGYAILQDSIGRMTGLTPPSIKSPIPRWYKDMEKVGLDLGKVLTGGK